MRAAMKLLLDTHAFVWWAASDSRLSRPALAELENPDNERFLSVVAAWEFQWIQARGRVSITTPLDIILATAPVTCIGVPFDLHRYSASLPPIHGDPVDRMLVAHALRDDMVLVSRDSHVHRYPVKVLW
jgi:PIN domain nuclease of toxin-antitoxin system